MSGGIPLLPYVFMACTRASLLLAFALLGCYAALVCSSLTMLRMNLSSPFSRRQVHCGGSLKSRKISLFGRSRAATVCHCFCYCYDVYYTTVVLKQSSVLIVHKELEKFGMCWFGESKTRTEFWRGNSVKVVV